MKLKLKRIEFTEKSTIGELSIDGALFCYTIEDKDRKLEIAGNQKIKGLTAIPRGTYEVVMTYSNRFKQYMPLILNVPFFEGIRIHTGNTSEHTEGCLIVGTQKGKDMVMNSRIAYTELLKRIKSVEKKEKIFIEII